MIFTHKFIYNVLFNKTKKNLGTFLHLYVFYVFATFHCILTSGFRVCTLASDRTDHNKSTLNNNMSELKNEQNSFPCSTPLKWFVFGLLACCDSKRSVSRTTAAGENKVHYFSQFVNNAVTRLGKTKFTISLNLLTTQ